MPDLPHDQIRAALSGQPLFEDKTWQLSPEAWPVTPDQLVQLEAIGLACLEFHQALETLYLRSVAGKNLLRNKPLLAPWVADYLDRGKPADLIAHARDPKNRGAFPTVLRPDLLLTDEGFALTELDSVPGGIGLTAFLNRLYAPAGGVIGADDAMVANFYAALAALRPETRNPFIALVVSDEAATYRPEMQWLAHQLQLQGKRVSAGLFDFGGHGMDGARQARMRFDGFCRDHHVGAIARAFQRDLATNAAAGTGDEYCFALQGIFTRRHLTTLEFCFALFNKRRYALGEIARRRTTLECGSLRFELRR